MQRVLSIVIGLSLFVPIARYQTDLVERASTALETLTSPTDTVDAPAPFLGRIVNELRSFAP